MVIFCIRKLSEKRYAFKDFRLAEMIKKFLIRRIKKCILVLRKVD